MKIRQLSTLLLCAIALVLAALPLEAAIGDLGGTSWYLVGYSSGGDYLRQLEPGSEVSLDFGRDGRINGRVNGRPYTAAYSVSGKPVSFSRSFSHSVRIAISKVGASRMPHGEAAEYIKAFSSAVAYRMAGGQLDLLDRNGTIMATFLSSNTSTDTEDRNLETYVYTQGDKEIVITLSNDKDILMTWEGKSYRMLQTVSASGARYEALDEPETVFWNKGDRAILTIKGHDIPGEFVEVRHAVGHRPSAVRTASAAAPQHLHDVEWKVVRLDGKKTVPDSEITLTFASDGSLFGKASINSYRSAWINSGDRIIIRGAASTMMAGPEALMKQEQTFLSLLENIKSYEMKGAELTLTTFDGKKIIAEAK